MREIDAQKSLVSIAFAQSAMPVIDSQGLSVYKELVFHRFFETLSNAFPIFYSIIEKQKFRELIYKFMQSGAKTTVMWRLPNEFRLFIKKEKLLRDIVFVDDLLWYEWIEIYLLMQTPGNFSDREFSWEDEYTLNQNAYIKKLNFRVFEPEHYEQKGEFYLLAYYDLNDFRVYYREISLLMYLFLQRLKSKGLDNALCYIAAMSDEAKPVVQEFFQESLKELLALQVIRQKIKRRQDDTGSL